MIKRIVRITSNKREAQIEAKNINFSFRERNIKREAVVGVVSQSYVKRLTRKGYPIAKKNYGIYITKIRKPRIFRKNERRKKWHT